MAREHPRLVDSYMQYRLHEHSWEENDELYSQCAVERHGSGSEAVWAGSRNSTILTKSRPSISLGMQSQGHTPHSTTNSHLGRCLGHESIPNKLSPHEPLLEKRYRFSSVPAATSMISGRPPGKRPATHSPSPSSTRRGFRKIRKGYPTKLSLYFSSQASTRKSVRVASRDTCATVVPPSTGGARLSLNSTLPRVGQRSNETERYHNGKEAKWTQKPYERSHSLSVNETKSKLSHRSSQNTGSFRLPNKRTYIHDRDRNDDIRLCNQHKKSASAGAVGVAKLWRCVGVKGWRGGDCCCEDEGEELRMSVMGDTIVIEDATDESVLEDGGSEEDEGGTEGGDGFSVEDLTDLEDEASNCSPAGDDCPVVTAQMKRDPITYTLLQKACQQLQQLSIDSSSDTDDSETKEDITSRKHVLRMPRHTKQDQTKPKHDHHHYREHEKPIGQRVTKSDQSEPKPATFDNGLLHKEVALPITCFAETKRRSNKEAMPGRKPVALSSTLPLTEAREGVTRDPSLPSPPLTPSLFPGLEPTIHFPMPDEPYTLLPPAQRGLLKWKMSTITPNVIKNCIARAGFTQCTKGGGWLGYWGKHMRSQAFRAVREHQKVNHFPGSFEIGRKDRLWRNLAKLQSRVGKRHLDFVPLTFVLPHDLRLLKREWDSGDHSKQKWILKPPAAARGIGVRVVHKWNQIPKKKPIIVQRYIADPFLINGNKFDLRVYVYVSSYDPLKIYVFRDGLARFATCKYSSSMRSLSNRFIHITNYSVNKKNIQFTQNPDETQCQGHKWGLLALWQYMSGELGLNTESIWESIKDLIIKTIICSESHCSSLVKAYVQNSCSCHELFGFDIMLDRTLKPWIVEVNISPSLHSNSQLDINIKGRMVRDLLNIAGFRVPLRDTPQHTAERSSCSQQYTLTTDERLKHSHFLQRTLPECERRKILDKLTPEDVAVLMQTEDEYSRRGMFERIFPCPHSSRYRKFFESEKYYNILLEQWLLKHQRLPSRGVDMLQRLARSSQ